MKLDRFWDKVNKTDGCWLWTASRRGRMGYGTIRWSGRQQLTHRISWKIHNGEIPDEMNVLHTCNNPICVNPDHLYIGTQVDNMIDMVRSKRSNHNAVLLPRQVMEIRRLYAEGLLNQYELADNYGVTQGMISKIINRRSWSYV